MAKDEKKPANNARGGKANSAKSRSPIPNVNFFKKSKKAGWRGFAIYAVMGILLFVFFAATANPQKNLGPVEPLSKVINDINDENIKSIEIDEDKLNIVLKDDSSYQSRKEENQSFF